MNKKQKYPMDADSRLITVVSNGVQVYPMGARAKFRWTQMNALLYPERRRPFRSFPIEEWRPVKRQAVKMGWKFDEKGWF